MTRSTTIRLVLCRPQGGLNDIFCQIVNTCEYGKKFGRKVFIDTAYVHSNCFWDVFTRYFVGRASFQIHKFLQVQDEIVDTLMQRLAAIGQPYSAIHIRHSDIQTNYAKAIASLKSEEFEKIFVATDNADVLSDFRSALGASRVVSFTKTFSIETKPLQMSYNSDEAQRFLANNDAILDLLLLAFAEKLTILKTSINPHGVYSGFSLLAKAFHDDHKALHSFLMRPDFAA